MSRTKSYYWDQICSNFDDYDFDMVGQTQQSQEIHDDPQQSSSDSNEHPRNNDDNNRQFRTIYSNDTYLYGYYCNT